MEDEGNDTYDERRSRSIEQGLRTIPLKHEHRVRGSYPEGDKYFLSSNDSRVHHAQHEHLNIAGGQTQGYSLVPISSEDLLLSLCPFPTVLFYFLENKPFGFLAKGRVSPPLFSILHSEKGHREKSENVDNNGSHSRGIVLVQLEG